MSLPATLAGYRVLAELGRGGMGVVYEVRAPHDPRPLALKTLSGLLDADDLLRFVREAELMARLQHPHVIRIVNAGRLESGQPFLVTERIEGEDLDARLRRGRLPAEDSARVVRALCDAVAALHAEGILHRDLKPANVMLRPDGSPVLLDFGLARDPGAETLTQSGTVLGTPGFMAPEQVDGLPFAELDGRVDVYGLGAILYFLLCGRPPVDAGGGLAAVAHATFEQLADWSLAPDAPPALVAIGRQALAKERAARYPTATDMRDDLDRFLAGEAVTAPLLTPTPRGRAAAVLAALVLLGATLAAGLAVALQTATPTPTATATTASPTPGVAPTVPPPTADAQAPSPTVTPVPGDRFHLTTLVPSGAHQGPRTSLGCLLYRPDRVLFFCSHQRALLTWTGRGKAWIRGRLLELPFRPQGCAQMRGPPQKLVISGGAGPKPRLLAIQGWPPPAHPPELDLSLRLPPPSAREPAAARAAAGQERRAGRGPRGGAPAAGARGRLEAPLLG